MVPRLIARDRRASAAQLAILALAQAGLAAAFAGEIGALAAASPAAAALIAPIAMAIAAGGALAMERYVAERFAQSFVIDCRAALFDSVIRHRGEGGDARWLTGLVGDMTALRNYAMRGSVKLVTAALSGCAALLWLMIGYPAFALAAVPLLVALALLVPVARLLSGTIARQRKERGRLTRFLIRRVRIEMSGQPTPNGHGRRNLASLSGTLAAKAIERASLVGGMEAVALTAGMASSLALILAGGGQDAGTLLAGFAIIGFAATRLLEAVRALHARIGGTVSLLRLQALIDRPRRNTKTIERGNDHG